MTALAGAGGRFAGTELVLFDLDGTLTASGPGILNSVRYALTGLGHPVPTDEQLQRFIGPPLAESFRDVCGLGPDRARDAITRYREYYADRGQFENSVFDGIPDVLAALTAQGRTLAVATSKPEVFAVSILAHFDLAEPFAAVVGSELDGRRSSKADLIAEALRRLGSPAGDRVMVGDRRHDVAGATATGTPCVGVLWGYGTADELASAGAAALVETPQDLLDVLTS